MVQIDKVYFQSNGIKLTGELYTPENPSQRKNAAIIISHPMTGVKEQTAGLHAQKLAEAGFFTLTFDAAYQGESEGEPRFLEDPYQRAEDIRSAVTYLSTLDQVDKERIGALGICASGGYLPYAAQSDLRIKAIATVSAACTGRLTREGLLGTAAETTREAFVQNVRFANDLRVAEAKGEKQHTYQILPPRNNVAEGVPTMFREAADYYQGPRGYHPRGPNTVLTRSTDLLANYDSYRLIELLEGRPLLMIAGSEADTKYYSIDAIARAKEPKELFEIPGKTHVGIYDDLSVSVPKLISFFSKSIA